MREYFVYIVASRSRTLYVGVTCDLIRRVHEHKQKRSPGFTSRYNISRLVYVENSPDVRAAIAREKQIKGWVRAKKEELVRRSNPDWEDLSERWYRSADPSLRSG
jgi:putative endonuclease